MSRVNVTAAAEPTIGERGFMFCNEGVESLLEVRAEAHAVDVRERAWTLIATIAEVLEKACARGAEHGDDEAMDTSTAYILKFAADAAAAMVGSLEVK